MREEEDSIKETTKTNYISKDKLITIDDLQEKGNTNTNKTKFYIRYFQTPQTMRRRRKAQSTNKK